MHNKRKGITAVIMVFVLSFTILGAPVLGADSNIIYESSDKQTITRGVEKESIVRYTTSGWLNINILRVNLADEYLKVDTLMNTDAKGKLSSVKTLANNSGAVAAINASFFTSSGSGKGYPLGPIIKSGSITCDSNDFNTYGDSMASFSLTKLNEVMLNYWKSDISIVAPNSTIIPVARYNKVNGSQYTDFTIMDRKWGSTSVGASDTMPDIVEMVVDGGVVSQILVSQPAVTIPENGYVVITRTAGGKQLTDNFKVGDSVALNITTTPDWNNFNMSVTGGSILVKDGQIPSKFSFDTAEMARNQPRTVIASTKDGKTLMLVTVDGRQNSSIGMTQAGIAQYMLDIGAYNALNLDGGGSTTMVAREIGQTGLSVLNSPSDGLARGISTAIGVFSIAPPSDLAGLIVDTEDSNIFVNTSRSFSVRGYDKYFNPITVDPAQVKWSATGVKGTFEGNVFKPTTYGEGKIIAKVGAISVTYSISVLSSPVKIVLSQNTLKLPINKTSSFTIKGYNKNGYSTSIAPEDVKWAVKGKIGAFNGITFTATTRGTGYIDASVGKTHAYCAVSVSEDVTTIRDKFEAANGAFASYPETVKGEYTISEEQKVSGKTSGKMTYDFTNTEGTRAAYMVLNKDGMALEAGASKLSIQVYNDHENSNWLRAEIIDAKGEKQVVDFTKNLDWTGWKQVEASLENIKTPAKLTRIYLAQINPVAESGSIYMDDLSVTNSGYPAIDLTKIPKDTVSVDESNKSVSFSKATADSFRFGVFGQSHQAVSTLEKKLVTRYAEKIDKYLDAAVILGDGFHDSVTKLIKKKPVISLSTVDSSTTKEVDYKYSYKDIKNSRFFKMDIRKNGLRLSDSAQWQKFQTDLNSFTGSNAFILLETNPNNFTDTLELNLFKQTLTKYKQKTGKTVWVFYKSDKNESYMERGIKYISTAGYDVAGLTTKKTDPATYVLVTVKGKTVTYTFKPII
jgi:Exopolysaccharide biosynthesis protein related to N-acetylglucosamine-1-phosphodiester alpha-N-acetylglucosaminidase